jgi:Xaa-Pro dipeptidase
MSSYAARRTALRQALQAANLDALLVTNLLNVRYLTGFTGSNAAVLVDASGDDTSVFCTDGRYLTQSAKQVPDLERLIDRPCDTALASRAKGRLGFESHHVTVDGLDELTAAAGKAELHKAGGLVEKLRLVKDEVEIEALRMACAAADRALGALIGHGGLRAGRTEREIARELESRMLDHGAEGPAFSSIVAFGANSAVPHHSPTDAVLHTGDFIKLDFGALVDGYHSDMTRTLVLGRPADWQRELYDLVARSQAAGRAGDPRGTGVVEGGCRYTFGRYGGHRRARRLLVGAGRGPHRGHPRGARKRAGAPHPDHEGTRGRLTSPSYTGEIPPWPPRTT